MGNNKNVFVKCGGVYFVGLNKDENNLLCLCWSDNREDAALFVDKEFAVQVLGESEFYEFKNEDEK